MRVCLALLLVCSVLVTLSGCANAGKPAEAAESGGVGTGLLVLCSSCTPPGEPPSMSNAGVMFLDQKSGEIWLYNEASFTGAAKPLYVGKLAKLGQAITK